MFETAAVPSVENAEVSCFPEEASLLAQATSSSECAPLLPSSLNHSYDRQLQSDREIEPEKSALEILAVEAKVLAKFSCPLMLTFMLQMSLSITNVWFVGSLGPTELAAYSLANMYAMLTGLASVFGFATAIDTLSSNGFTGAEDPFYLGVILQRAIVVMFSIILPFAGVAWMWAEKFLSLMGQDPILAKMAGEYLRVFILGMPFFIIFVCIRKSLQAQGLMAATFHTALATAIFNAFSNHFFIRVLNLGFRGAPIAIAFTYMFAALANALAMWLSAGAKVWGGLDLYRALDVKGATQFAKLGFPGAATIAQDWALELCAISAGFLGRASLAAQSIVMQANMILAMVNFSLGISTGVRVGNHLGSGPNFARCAKITTIVGICSGAAIAAINGTVLISVRKEWGSLFTEDEDVLQIVADMMPVAAIAQVALGMGVIAASVLGAAGLQRYTAAINLFTAYAIGLPLGILLAFSNGDAIFSIQLDLPGRGFGLKGLWMGMAVANAVALMCKGVVLARFNWELEADKAKERVAERRRGE